MSESSGLGEAVKRGEEAVRAGPHSNIGLPGEPAPAWSGGRANAVPGASPSARFDSRPIDARLPGALDEIEAARAAEYALLAALLLRAPDAEMLERLSRIEGDDTPLGLAHASLAQAASQAVAAAVEREFFDLFIGVGRGELLPYGSYYLTGFLHERPLARLRGDLDRLGIARDAGRCEPEDHIATLCEIMSGLITGALGPPAEQARFFERHLSPWAGRFFADLEKASAARFYRAVGTAGRVFMSIETDALALPA